MNVRIISPRQSLIEEIIPHLKHSERDYSSSLVVFPGRRPSHFLRKALSGKIKSGFIPPVIHSMDDFIDALYEEKVLKPRRRLETIDAVSILYDIQKEASTPLGGEGFMTLESFFPLGLKIYRDIEELYIEDINPDLVKEIEPFIEEGLPDKTVKRLQSLSHFYKEFYRAIEEGGFSTRSLRYRTVSAEIEEAELYSYKRIIFAGFFAFTRSEKALFRKILSWDNTLFLFQDGKGMKERLSDLGLSMDGEKGEEVEQAIYFYRSPDTHGQVFGLTRILKTKLEEGIPMDERTVIVLPSSETLFPLLRQTLSLFDEGDYNISLGYPLHRTPVFGFLNNLMELITSRDGDRLYIPDYLKFVLHPYTKNIYFKGDPEITRILFHTIEEELIKCRTKTFTTPVEIEGNEELFRKILERVPRNEGITKKLLRAHLGTIHENTVEKFLSFENIHDFTVKCIELLTYIFNNSTARFHPLFHPSLDVFIKALYTIQKSLMKDRAFTEINSYFTLFRKYIMTCHVPFEGTPIRGLQVLGFLETRNLSFERVLILDTNEEIIPDTRKEDTLLPLRAREILGLPTYMDRDNLTAYYFDSLLKRAKEIYLFFVEDDRKEKSRLVEKLLWEKQKKDKTAEAKEYLRSLQYRVTLKNKLPCEIKKTEGMIQFLRDHSYTATALDDYLKCQLKFYYGSILDIGRKEEISGDIEKADIGKFVHAALSKYFLRRKNYPLKEEDINLKEMDLLTDEFFDGVYGSNPAGATYLLKKQIKNHLKDFLKDYTIPLIKEKSITILDIERDIEISRNSFKLKGRLDSIEKRGEEIFIIDYKTSSNADYLKIDFDRLDINSRETWSEAIGSLQLPFYLLLYSKRRERIKDLNGIFLLLGRAVINRDIEIPLFDNQEKAGKRFELFKKVIFRLLEEIVDPTSPFRPTENRKELCPLCDFQYICGTQWVIK
ncbi:MAG: PD-(D/E)XK nuclease family protein [Nitrospirota bacterium]